MKKYLIPFVGCAICALITVSCETTKKDTYTVRMVESEMGIITTPIIVELDSVSMTRIVQTVNFDAYEYSGDERYRL
jgi:hypothetical protein